MVRTTKTTTTTPAVPENIVVEKKKSSKKEKVADVAPPAPVADTTQVTEEGTVFAKLSDYSAKLQQLSNLFASVKSDFKTLEKTVARELKTALKNSQKKRKVSANRAPSGFVKPTKITDELATFLGKTLGCEMARTEVSKEINLYIREHKLQDKDNGRKIHPDAALTKLLNIGKDEELTYFNLQRYMKHHFIKAVPVV